MRPLSEVLPYAFLHLFDPVNRQQGDEYICYALFEARRVGDITHDEEDAAVDFVMNAVRELDPQSTSLSHAACARGHFSVPLYLHHKILYDEEYVDYRDKWLNALIEKAKTMEQHNAPHP